MPLAARPRSVRGMLLILLLPAATGLMALAWVIHGALLERMSTDFVESRLKDEVAFLEHQIRQASGRIDTLQASDYFQEVFHHAFAIASTSRQTISPEAWAMYWAKRWVPGVVDWLGRKDIPFLAAD